MRIPITWATAVPVAGLLALASCFAADPKDRPAGDPGKLVVHEWGTFSTFSGSDGKNLKFNPYDNDLPDFVHAYLTRDSKEGPAGGTISLETPVIYFYSDRETTASVHVEFPKGIFTEWYPQAARTDTKLDWKGIRVAPGDAVRLPTEKKASRYYAARETDAAPLTVAFKDDNRRIAEQEKFLFYRGVGEFNMPLSVRAAAGGKFTVTWRGRRAPTDLILVRIQGGKVRFRPFSDGSDEFGILVKSGRLADIELPSEDSTAEKLGDELARRLIARGLKEKEARAMIKTWSEAWFGEEGTRVLYILPDELTSELLPLQVDPKPTSLVRVLVGRHDVLTPEREKQIDGWVAQVRDSSSENAPKLRAAEAKLAKLGRYQAAAYRAAETRIKKDR